MKALIPALFVSALVASASSGAHGQMGQAGGHGVMYQGMMGDGSMAGMMGGSAPGMMMGCPMMGGMMGGPGMMQPGMMGGFGAMPELTEPQRERLAEVQAELQKAQQPLMQRMQERMQELQALSWQPDADPKLAGEKYAEIFQLRQQMARNAQKAQRQMGEIMNRQG